MPVGFLCYFLPKQKVTSHGSLEKNTKGFTQIRISVKLYRYLKFLIGLMKKAIISTGNKQYLVSEGDEIEVDKLQDKKLNLDVLLVIDGDKVKVGKPKVEGASVTANVTEPLLLGEKVIAIRYKAKKRVRKIRGHRQSLSKIKITKITD